LTHISHTAVYAWPIAPRGGDPDLADSLPRRGGARFAGSRFELIAARAETLPPHQSDLLGPLFQAAHTTGDAGRAVLRPLWAEEGMHRAYALLRLINRKTERSQGRPVGTFGAGVERALARDLATAYRALAIGRDDERVACSVLLRDIALGIGALFGGGAVVVRTMIDPITLPAYKRRALVLAASELLVNALTHAFPEESRGGRIDVSLRALDDRRACLRVADDGVGIGAISNPVQPGVASGLADLVEAELVYYRTANWATLAEIIFPIDPDHLVAGRDSWRRST
jgi:two-component sensor histidine kinase